MARERRLVETLIIHGRLTTMRSLAGIPAVFFTFALALPPFAWSAAAQSAYVGGTAFAEIKQFGSSNISYPFGSTTFSPNATGVGGGVRIGTYLHPRWSLELSLDAGSRTEAEVENPIMILIFPPPPRTTLKASTRYTTVSTMVGFHPAAMGRVQLAYRGGFAFLHGTYKSEFPGFFPQVLTGITIGTISSPTLPTILSPRPVSLTTTTQSQNTGALILGFDAAINLTAKLALVPEIRALVFSAPNNGSGIFLIRPGVGIRWTF